MNENEMVSVPEARYDLSIARAPKQVLAEATDAAKALNSVISQSKSVVKFQGKTYLAFEHFQTLGRFYGVTAKIVSTESIDMGGVVGFLARAEAVTQDGRVVSAADAMCLSDEKNWAGKPLFQLRSMAQTRACAKSLRNVLAWVVVLAGYEPNVAEEMTGDEQGAKPEPIKPPTPKAETNVLTFVPAHVTSKPTAKGGTRYGVKISDGDWYGTFDEEQGQLALKAFEDKTRVKMAWKQDGDFKNIVTIENA